MPRKKEQPALGYYSRGKISLGLGGELKTLRSERLITKVPESKLEKIYRLEPLIFNGINMLSRLIVTPFFLQYPEGTKENEKEIWEDFIKRTKLDSYLYLVTKDALLYGNGWLEIIYNVDNTDILGFNPINPDEIDYKRTGDAQIELDEMGQPVGFKWTNVLRGGEKELKIEEVVHIKFYTLGDDFLGISLIEPLYKSAIIKLNIEDALGNAIHRRTFPLYVGYIGSEKAPDLIIQEEKLKQLSLDLAKASHKASFAFPWYYKIEKIEPSDLSSLQVHLDHFVNLICSGLGIPKGLLIGTGDVRGALEAQLHDFEKEIITYQSMLQRQVEDQIFKRFQRIKDLTSLPTIVWKPISPQTALSRARRLGILARCGLITHDDELENFLRKEEGLVLKRKDLGEEKEEEKA